MYTDRGKYDGDNEPNDFYKTEDPFFQLRFLQNYYHLGYFS